MKLRNRGYLLIDVVIGIMIFSIISLLITTSYSRYYKMKIMNNMIISSLEIFNSVCMEIYYNTRFEEILKLIEGKNYYLITRDINHIISNDILDLISFEKKEADEYCLVRRLNNDNDFILDIEIEYYKKQGEIVYMNKEIIRKYEFI